MQDALQQQATQKEYRDAVDKAVAKIVEIGLGGKKPEDVPDAKPDESIPLQQVETQAEVENTGVDDTIEHIANKIGIPKSKIDEILKTPKGSRPDPKTYLSKDYIANHLAKFNNGVTKIVAQAPIGTAGPPSGTFIMPSSVANEIIAKAGGDVAQMEKLLGFPKSALGVNPVRIDIAHPKELRIPSGNELGANLQWIPGGYTSGGLIEAIIDSPISGQYTVTKIK